MKRILNGRRWLILACAGTVFVYAGSSGWADDTTADRQHSQLDNLPSNDSQAGRIDVKGNEINEPAGAEKKNPTSDPYLSHKSNRLSSSAQDSQEASATFGKLSKASDVIGTEVRNEKEEKLGEVKDVVIDAKGHIPFVILSSDSSDKLLAIPPSVFSAGSDEKTLVLNIDKDRLNSAPSFDRSQWPNMSDRSFRRDIYQFYDARPYWRGSSLDNDTFQNQASATVTTEPAGSQAAAVYNNSANVTSGSAKEIDERANRILHMYQAGKQQAAVVDRRLHENPPEVILPPPAEYKERYAHNSEIHVGRPSQREIVEPSGAETAVTTGTTEYAAPPAPRASREKLYRATELMGMDLKDTTGHSVGEIKDIALDLKTGRVAYSVVSAGGFLGVGERWVAIPPSLFSTSSSQMLVVNVDKEKLKNAPMFDRSNWESVSSQDYVTKVYGYYGQPPYWQAKGPVNEPAGAERNRESLPNDQLKNQQEREFENKDQIEEQKRDLQDESRHPDQSQLKSDTPSDAATATGGLRSDAKSASSRESNVNEPAGAAKEAEELNNQNAAPTGGVEENKGALEENKEAPERSSSEIQEPSGAERKSVDETSSGQSSRTETEASAPSAGFQSSSSEAEKSGISESAGAARDQISLDRIRSAIQSDPKVSDSSIQVSSENGKIILRGTVNSETEKQQIEQKVRELIVDDQLRVQEGASTHENSSNPNQRKE